MPNVDFSAVAEKNREVWDNWLTQLISPNKTIANGHGYVRVGINEKIYIPKIDATGNLLQDFTNGAPSGSGTIGLTETELTPEKSLLYLEMTPNDFRSYWRFSSPDAFESLVFTELPENFRRAMEEVIVRRTNFSIAQCLWAGDSATSPAPSYPLGRFTGWLTKAVNNADVIDISGASGLTAGNVLEKLQEVYEAIPDAVLMSPNIKMFVSVKTGKLIQKASNDIAGKGTTFLTVNGLDDISFDGVKVVVLPEFPDDVIFSTHSSADESSNLWAGATNAETVEPFRYDRVAPNQEIWFVKGAFAMDTAIINGNECVLYDAR